MILPHVIQIQAYLHKKRVNMYYHTHKSNTLEEPGVVYSIYLRGKPQLNVSNVTKAFAEITQEEHAGHIMLQWVLVLLHQNEEGREN